MLKHARGQERKKYPSSFALLLYDTWYVTTKKKQHFENGAEAKQLPLWATTRPVTEHLNKYDCLKHQTVEVDKKNLS